MFEWILNAPLELARNAYLLTRILMLTANSNYGWIVYLITPQIDCLCMIFYHKFCKDMKVCHKWILLFFMSDDSLSSLFVFLLKIFELQDSNSLWLETNNKAGFCRSNLFPRNQIRQGFQSIHPNRFLEFCILLTHGQRLQSRSSESPLFHWRSLVLKGTLMQIWKFPYIF